MVCARFYIQHDPDGSGPTTDSFDVTLESKVVSWFRQNKYAQVFSTRFGWTRVFPIRKKAEAHHELSLLAQRDGIPPVVVIDGPKEQTMAESAIRELKRGAGRKMAKQRVKPSFGIIVLS
jgi:hypothetical protein